MQDSPVDDTISRDPTLRLLRRLVVGLTATMIAGLIIVVAVIVIRFPSSGGDLVLPKDIHLPAGEQASAVTQGQGWVAIVTVSGKILVFDVRTGKLRHSYALGN